MRITLAPRLVLLRQVLELYYLKDERKPRLIVVVVVPEVIIMLPLKDPVLSQRWENHGQKIHSELPPQQVIT
jgi:hypothetical protein